MPEKTYVATKPLYVGTALAHNPGDVVSAESVHRNGWTDSVSAETKGEARPAS